LGKLDLESLIAIDRMRNPDLESVNASAGLQIDCKVKATKENEK
jgi:hypothetical protein